MKKYPKIKRLGHNQNQGILDHGNLLLKEKLDGANFRFTVTDNGQLLFGSRNVEYKINGEPDYTENVDNRFKAAIEHIRDTVDVDELEEYLEDEHGATQMTFFGENMVKHSLEYDWDNIPQFIGFDIYCEECDQFLDYESVQRIYEEIGLATAPVVDKIHVDEFDEDYEVPESQWRDGKAEGVVIINTDQEEDRPSGFQTRAKLVTDEFVEKHQEEMGGGGREAVHDHEKIVSKYCTEGRIRKHVMKMVDEGRELGMQLMENQDDSTGLPLRVVEDVFEEEYPELVRSNYTFEMKEIRSRTAKRCVSVLRRVMKNTELNDELTVAEGAEQ